MENLEAKMVMNLCKSLKISRSIPSFDLCIRTRRTLEVVPFNTVVQSAVNFASKVRGKKTIFPRVPMSSEVVTCCL